MELIYSKLQPTTLLHIVHRLSDFGERKDIISPAEVIQLAPMKIQSGVSFRPHRHLKKDIDISNLTAQESWVVLSGIVMAIFYDVDDKFLAEFELAAGDFSVSLAGGHGYRCVEEAKVIEFKTGPYLGQEKDKVFID